MVHNTLEHTVMFIYLLIKYFFFINTSSFSVTTEQTPSTDEGHEMQLKVCENSSKWILS